MSKNIRKTRKQSTIKEDMAMVPLEIFSFIRHSNFAPAKQGDYAIVDIFGVVKPALVILGRQEQSLNSRRYKIDETIAVHPGDGPSTWSSEKLACINNLLRSTLGRYYRGDLMYKGRVEATLAVRIINSWVGKTAVNTEVRRRTSITTRGW